MTAWWKQKRVTYILKTVYKILFEINKNRELGALLEANKFTDW